MNNTRQAMPIEQIRELRSSRRTAFMEIADQLIANNGVFNAIERLVSIAGTLTGGAAAIWAPRSSGISALAVGGPLREQLYGECPEPLHPKAGISSKINIIRRIDEDISDAGPRSYVSAPIWVRGVVWGTFEIFSSSKNGLSNKDLAALQYVCLQIGQAVEASVLRAAA